MLSRDSKLYLRLVFKQIYNSVKPKRLISSEVKFLDNKLIIDKREYSLKNNCYVVGFGKAVYDMGCEIDSIIKNHIRGAVLSVPEGSINVKDCQLKNKSHFKIVEGAKNNIPDINSHNATKEIVNLIKPLKEDDLLLVLISGGGSALLTSPLPPVTLDEKILVTKLLSHSGADIKELNTVRKQLSAVKGGKLAQIAYPCQILSLVLSDVINDPLDMIASGPTVKNNDSPGSGLSVLEKYSLLHKVPKSVIKVLTEYKCNDDLDAFEKSHTIVIGNNSKALSFGKEFILDTSKVCSILTSCVEGSVEIVANALVLFVKGICQFLLNEINLDQYTSSVSSILETLSVSEEDFNELYSILSSGNKELFLLFGGETTVNVKGKGIGGRNMELALRFSKQINDAFNKSHYSKKFEIGLLCGGTDGIDGPTDSAGAIAYLGQMDLAIEQGLNPDNYITENNSYTFFRTLNGGEDLIVTGHTGTNVMDVMIVFIKKIT